MRLINENGNMVHAFAKVIKRQNGESLIYWLCVQCGDSVSTLIILSVMLSNV